MAEIIVTSGSAGGSGPCPRCKKRVHVLEVDDDETADAFPVVKWTPFEDLRTSKAHFLMAYCGIKGTPYFLRDDLVLAGWWIARRKGLKPCRCDFVLVSNFEAIKLEIPLERVKHVNFDPWNDDRSKRTKMLVRFWALFEWTKEHRFRVPAML
jgi:hypothetical protein